VRGIRDLWTTDDKENVAVSKIGAQTGETRGTLKPAAADLRVQDLRVRYSMGWWAEGNDAVFAEPGDSGAIVVDEERNAIGMLVAVSTDGAGDRAPGAFVHGMRRRRKCPCIAAKCMTRSSETSPPMQVRRRKGPLRAIVLRPRPIPPASQRAPRTHATHAS